MVLPSRELFSAVLGYEVKVTFINREIDYNKHLWYKLRCGDTESINIYELMHMMKKWAVTKGYAIQSEAPWNEEYRNGFIRQGIAELRTFTLIVDIFNANTEHEAVTKACEWILEQQK